MRVYWLVFWRLLYAFVTLVFLATAARAEEPLSAFDKAFPPRTRSALAAGAIGGAEVVAGTVGAASAIYFQRALQEGELYVAARSMLEQEIDRTNARAFRFVTQAEINDQARVLVRDYLAGRALPARISGGMRPLPLRYRVFTYGQGALFLAVLFDGSYRLVDAYRSVDPGYSPEPSFLPAPSPKP